MRFNGKPLGDISVHETAHKPPHVLEEEAYSDLCDAVLSVEEASYALTNVTMNNFSSEQIDDALAEVYAKLNEACKVQERRKTIAQMKEGD